MTSHQVTNRTFHPFIRGLQFFYLALAWLFALCVAIQAYFAGLGTFFTATWFEAHTALGWSLFLSVLPMLILAAVARFPRIILLLNLLLICDIFLQAGVVSFLVPLGYPALTAFHVSNALILFLIAILLASQAQRWIVAQRKTLNEVELGRSSE